jgi:hypothetical protein
MIWDDSERLRQLAESIMRLVQAITRGYINRLYAEDSPAHEWFRFVLSFPPHLVRGYVQHFELTEDSRVLDPFCGTGTTLVECKKLGIASVGSEGNPFAQFATKVKTDWSISGTNLLEEANQIARIVEEKLGGDSLPEVSKTIMQTDQKIPNSFRLKQLPPESAKLLLTDSISPIPLHRCLTLLEAINGRPNQAFRRHLQLALANAVVNEISNLHFGPEVGVSKPKFDTPVVAPWLANITQMASDLIELHRKDATECSVHLADVRDALPQLHPNSIDAVITSPPYPNEKDYTRTTRLESVLLGFLQSRADLRRFKKTLVRSNTRTIYKGDDDDEWIRDNEEIAGLATEMERRRIELQKTSGFERLYATVTKQYFGGMARHLANLRPALRADARLVYIVGDQASYFRVLIRTGKLLGEIAESLGYQVVELQLFRERAATATKQSLREEGLILRWPQTTVSFNLPESRAARIQDMNGQSETEQIPNRYVQIIERIFAGGYSPGKREVTFDRTQIEQVAQALGISLPKNLGDLIYSFRYRIELPDSILKTAPEGFQWLIRPKGKALYSFSLAPKLDILPNPLIADTLIPDSTPGLVEKYALSDEQALLAKLRYNRIVDIATGITCYSIQNHLRTFVAGMGQVETDELYVGVDKQGRHYVFPVQTKRGKDRLNVIQLEQDFALCANKFPNLICHSIAAQFMDEGRIAIFQFQNSADGPKLSSEMHYKLVSPSEVTPEILATYRERLPAL